MIKARHTRLIRIGDAVSKGREKQVLANFRNEIAIMEDNHETDMWAVKYFKL